VADTVVITGVKTDTVVITGVKTDTVVIKGEKTVSVVTMGVQGPAGISGSSVQATTTTLGGIIVGDNLTITSNGVLSALGQSQLSQLSDVQLSSLTHGDLLSYNQSISKWANLKQSVVTDGGNF